MSGQRRDVPEPGSPDEDPRRLLLEVGVAPPDDDTPDPSALSALDALKARIEGDLEATQGHYRSSGPVARYGPALLAAGVGGAYVFALRPATLTPLLLAACVAAALAAALAFGGVVVAPSRPGFGERLSWAGIGVALVALGLEGVGGFRLGDAGFAPLSALRCSVVFTVGSGAPLALLLFGLRRSGLPVRRLHALGLCAAALAVGGLGVWRHCAPADHLHTAVVHLALPALLLPLLFGLVTRLSRRPRRG